MASLGYLHISRGEEGAQAANWLRKAAEKGNAGAMVALGLLYSEGRGVPRDGVQTFEWLKKAAEGGSEFAAYEFGLKYFQAKSDVEALRWYRKAADKGAAQAMTMVALFYRDGLSVAKNPRQSFE